MYKDYRYCNKHGHDWAIQDYDLFMKKICLRCGAKMCFFPEMVEYEPDTLVEPADRRNNRCPSEKLWSGNGGIFRCRHGC